MNKPEFSRPFNLEHARAGAPYCCRDGESATVLKWDGRRFNEPLVGCIGVDDVPASWGGDGRYVPDEHGPRPRDLVMRPLGFMDNKPVFVGDKIVDPNGLTIISACANYRVFKNCSWPKQDYPTTQMKLEDFDAALSKSGSHECISARAACAIANAALRHAIDAGQVVLPSTVASDDLLMKVAKEVFRISMGQDYFLNEKEEYFRHIIASVTGAKDAKEGAQ